MHRSTTAKPGATQDVPAQVQQVRQLLQQRPPTQPGFNTGIRPHTEYHSRFVPPNLVRPTLVPHPQVRPAQPLYAAQRAAVPNEATALPTQPFYDAREIAEKSSADIAQRLDQSPGNAVLTKAQFDKVTQQIERDPPMSATLSLALVRQYARLDPQRQAQVLPSVLRALARLVSRIVEPEARQAALAALQPVMGTINWGAQLREFGGGELQSMLYTLNKLGGDPADWDPMRDAIADSLGSTERFSPHDERAKNIIEARMIARITEQCQHEGILRECQRILGIDSGPAAQTAASVAGQAAERLHQRAPGSPPLTAAEIEQLLTTSANPRMGSGGERTLLRLEIINHFRTLDPQQLASVPCKGLRSVIRQIPAQLPDADRAAAVDALLPAVAAADWAGELARPQGGALQQMLFDLKDLDNLSRGKILRALVQGLNAVPAPPTTTTGHRNSQAAIVMARIAGFSATHPDLLPVVQACSRILGTPAPHLERPPKAPNARNLPAAVQFTHELNMDNSGLRFTNRDFEEAMASALEAPNAAPAPELQDMKLAILARSLRQPGLSAKHFIKFVDEILATLQGPTREEATNLLKDAVNSIDWGAEIFSENTGGELQQLLRALQNVDPASQEVLLMALQEKLSAKRVANIRGGAGGLDINFNRCRVLNSLTMSSPLGEPARRVLAECARILGLDCPELPFESVEHRDQFLIAAATSTEEFIDVQNAKKRRAVMDLHGLPEQRDVERIVASAFRASGTGPFDGADTLLLITGNKPQGAVQKGVRAVEQRLGLNHTAPRQGTMEFSLREIRAAQETGGNQAPR